jgi:anaerobic ribonucleoside-triphosphate reductase
VASNDLVRGGVTVPEEERTRCEVWTRVMGYYRPVSMWNEGKQSEKEERVAFAEPGQRTLQGVV